jgi:hypothetical protein
LFLATVVPAPRKWRYRLEDPHTVRRFVRAQMHFIGRAMVAKGWLEADRLPAHRIARRRDPRSSSRPARAGAHVPRHQPGEGTDMTKRRERRPLVPELPRRHAAGMHRAGSRRLSPGGTRVTAPGPIAENVAGRRRPTRTAAPARIAVPEWPGS